MRTKGAPPADPILAQRADAELAEVKRAIQEVFYRNVGTYANQLGKDDLLGLLVGSDSFNDVHDLFLFGIISELVENSPPLPTQPSDRIGGHLLFYFIGDEKLTLDEARTKVRKTTALHNDANPLFDWIARMGRQAYRTSDNDLLTQCLKATARQSVLDSIASPSNRRDLA
jgi:hypothetical protein